MNSLKNPCLQHILEPLFFRCAGQSKYPWQSQRERHSLQYNFDGGQKLQRPAESLTRACPQAPMLIFSNRNSRSPRISSSARTTVNSEIFFPPILITFSKIPSISARSSLCLNRISSLFRTIPCPSSDCSEDSWLLSGNGSYDYSFSSYDFR
jgi:hypothetical protein